MIVLKYRIILLVKHPTTQDLPQLAIDALIKLNTAYIMTDQPLHVVTQSPATAVEVAYQTEGTLTSCSLVCTNHQDLRKCLH